MTILDTENQSRHLQVSVHAWSPCDFAFAIESGLFIQTGRNLSEPNRPLGDFPWAFRSIPIPPHNDKCCRL